jgi:hypothetical protein
MTMAEPLNATFFAFRKRDRGGVLLGATIAYAIVAIVLAGAFVALNWQGVVDYMNWATTLSGRAAGDDPNDPFSVMTPPASVMALGGLYFLFLIFFYLLFAAYEAACLRWMIRGETKGFMGLALDGDTWRVYFTYWLWFFLLIAVYIVCAIVAFGAIAGLAAGAHGDSSTPGPTGLVAVVVVLAILLMLLYFGVRFSPAAATSVAKKRFAFFDAWTVTKGRFWALFGAFILLWLMYMVGVMVLSGVGVFAMGAGMMGQMAGAAEPSSPEEAFALFASPTVWVPLALIYGVMIAGAFVFYVALFGVNARAAQAALEEGKIQAAA